MTGEPPDRSFVPTETRHPDAHALRPSDTGALMETMCADAHSAVDAIRGVLDRIEAFVRDLEARYRRGGRLIYAGAGTSGRLGVLDASECPPTFRIEHGRVVGVIAGGDRALRVSSESMEDDPANARADLEAIGLSEDDVVIGISAGGTTPYALGAIEFAHDVGALTALLSCGVVPGGVRADHVINPVTGPEVIAGSTRLNAGTATKLVLNMISTGLMHRLGKVHEGLMVDLRATNDKLRDRAARIIAELTGLERGACFTLLDGAGGRVKVAVVMHRYSCDAACAEGLLRAHHDDLGAVLG